MTDYERERLLGLTDYADGHDYGIMPPCMDAQTALNELCSFFLGDDYGVPISCCARQANSEIVFTIEELYRKSRIRNRYGRKLH